jgi:hypothetical protein
MQFVCVFTEPGGSNKSFTFDAENKDGALVGLMQKCKDEVTISPDAKIDKLFVWPSILVYEDMTFDYLVVCNDSDGEVVKFLSELS